MTHHDADDRRRICAKKCSCGVYGSRLVDVAVVVLTIECISIESIIRRPRIHKSTFRRMKGLLAFLAGASMLAERCTSFSAVARAPSMYGYERSVSRPNASIFMSASAAIIENSVSTIKTYEHDGWTLSYRYKPPSRGFESKTPLLLIHPVGIGLSSWFWERIFQKWKGPAMYAPDLIGCGVKNGGDAWDPDEHGIFFPLSWVQACEGLLQTSIKPTYLFAKPTCNVVCQGGLTPIGVMMAARNSAAVKQLILTSPPTWEDMTTPIPEKEIAFNYAFLRNPIVAPVAFGLLETRWAIEFFSNLFLFDDKCDSTWIDLACEGIDEPSRPPVAAFNAGFCNARSYQEELETLKQPTLILSGKDDTRASERQTYVTNMQDCRMKSLPGKNVLPWESPIEVVDAIQHFCYN